MISAVLAFLLTLAVLIVIHEYGHYRVALACGIGVPCFSVASGSSLDTSMNRQSIGDAVLVVTGVR